VLATLAHLVFERTVWPDGAGQWLAVAGLGLGPVGFAFFFWDHGVKHGHIQALGASSYAAPLLSTLILIAAGYAAATPVVLLACLLITGGAALASAEMLRRRPPRASPA
jgi:drug/metabolite transporter (DMT)-like permease